MPYSIFFFLLVLLGWLLPCQSQAQQNANRILFLSDINFYIEADLFINNSNNSSVEDTGIGKVKVLSDHVRIGISKTVTIFDRLYNSQQPIFSPDGFEFDIQAKAQAEPHWRSIRSAASIENIDSDIFILDTLLDYSESFFIFFRNPFKQVVFSLEIERVSLAPEITYYRNIKRVAIKTGLSSSHNNGFKRLPAATSETEQYIEIEPGEMMEVVFRDMHLNTDTAIQYSLNSSNSQQHYWRTAGLSTLLTELKSNTIYTLEVKFKNCDKTNSYYIKVLPAWYQNTWLMLALITGILLLLSLPVYWYVRLKIKREQKNKAQVQYKLRAIQSQLNPHFIFNALSSIQSLVNKDKKMEANKYLSEFAGVMRGALKNSDTVLIPLAEELKLLKSYLQIEQLRFNFQFNLVISDSISVFDIEIPPMLIQPSLENAIKHGISSLGKDGVININFDRKEDDLHICITDNGGGHKLYEHSADGYGVKLTKERVAALNEIFKQRHVTYHITFTDTNTIVNFYFENWLT